jgi:TM2 domain-containing membrane protein YozV
VAASNVSPGFAFTLGFIPGVGAIYNGQYVKGLVHAAIIGLLLSLAAASDGSSGVPFIIMLMVAFWCYMPFEAFHTAKNRQAGLPVDEFSSLIAPSIYRTRAPIGPIVIILVGVLFLLETLHVLQFRELARFWPVLLIVAGAVMLYNRLTGLRGVPPPMESMESSHEQ